MGSTALSWVARAQKSALFGDYEATGTVEAEFAPYDVQFPRRQLGDSVTLSAAYNENGSWDALEKYVIQACCIPRGTPQWDQLVVLWKDKMGGDEADLIKKQFTGKIEKTLAEAFTSDYSQWKGVYAGMQVPEGIIGAAPADVLAQIATWEEKRVDWAKQIDAAIKASSGAGLPPNVLAQTNIDTHPSDWAANIKTIGYIAIALGGIYLVAEAMKTAPAFMAARRATTRPVPFGAPRATATANRRRKRR